MCLDTGQSPITSWQYATSPFKAPAQQLGCAHAAGSTWLHSQTCATSNSQQHSKLQKSANRSKWLTVQAVRPKVVAAALSEGLLLRPEKKRRMKRMYRNGNARERFHSATFTTNADYSVPVHMRLASPSGQNSAALSLVNRTRCLTMGLLHRARGVQGLHKSRGLNEIPKVRLGKGKCCNYDISYSRFSSFTVSFVAGNGIFRQRAWKSHESKYLYTSNDMLCFMSSLFRSLSSIKNGMLCG